MIKGCARSSRTQTDDLLFSGGYSPKISDRIRAYIFWPFRRLPTHKDTSLEFVQFGYGHSDLEHKWIAQLHIQLIAIIPCVVLHGFIHFFPRNSSALVNTSMQSLDMVLGNLVDLFVLFTIEKPLIA